jgi:hypothetical protein
VLVGRATAQKVNPFESSALPSAIPDALVPRRAVNVSVAPTPLVGIFVTLLIFTGDLTFEAGTFAPFVAVQTFVDVL